MDELFEKFKESVPEEYRDFITSNEPAINELWVKWRTQSSKEPTASQQVEVETANIPESQPTEPAPTGAGSMDDNQQTDMPKIFDSGATPDVKSTQNDALTLQIKNKQVSFLNGKVNQPYEVDFDHEEWEAAEVSFVGLDEIGLQYYPDEKKIKGLPTISGDHKITMKFKIKGYDHRPALERETIVIINPDPRVLWSKNIPSPQNDIDYPKPDSDKAFVKVASKEQRKYLVKKEVIARKDMVAASQRGRSHAIEGKPRDDDFDLWFDEETESYVMIVADGAGSAKYSRAGSQFACANAMAVCIDGLRANKENILKLNKKENKEEIAKIWQGIIASAVFEAYKAIEKEAQVKESATKDFATTLLLTICKKFEYGWFVAAWWVGDGGIGIYNKEQQWVKILGEPDGGEFAGQTRFLTMPKIIKDELYNRMKFEVVDDFTALVLMTDGITDPKFETDANLNRIECWDALWDDLNGKNEDGVAVDFSDDNEDSAQQLLKWLDFWSKGNHDDRTIAILY